MGRFLKTLCCFFLLLTSSSGLYANLDSLINVLSIEKSDSAQYVLLSKIVKQLENKDRAEAIKYAKQLLVVADKLKSPQKQGAAARIIGRNYLFIAKNDSSMIFLELSNEHYRAVNDSARINKNMGNIALIHQRNNDYEKAVETYIKVIEDSKSLGDYYSASSSIINLASIYIDQENEIPAIEKLLEVKEMYNLVPESDKKQRSSIEQLFPAVNINLGQCYADTEDLDKAMIHYKDALNTSKGLKNSFMSTYYASYANHSIGDLHSRKAENYEKASNSMMATSEWSQAKTFFQNGLAGFREIKNDRGETFSLTSLGRSMAKLGDLTSAEVTLLEGLEKAKASGFTEEMRDAYKSLSYTAKAKGDFKSSIEYFEKHVSYKDSIRNDERDAIMEDMKGKYEADKKENEIARLETENELKSRQQLLQLLIFLSSLIGIIGLSYVLYTRYRLKKERESAAFERTISSAMAKFVPHEFIQALGREKITDVLLGDQIEKEVTVLFTDIRSFTSISEGLDPKDNFRLIKEYAERMGLIIRKNKGFINQYLGDGIVAIFDGSPDDALRACIEMQAALIPFNKEQTITDREIKVGMGLNTGMLVMGIIGDEERLDVTLISDTVNTASRMESSSKALGAKIMMSKATVEKIKTPSDFSIRFVGDFKLEGKAVPLYIYECFDADSEELKILKFNTEENFAKATENYLLKDFHKAISHYNEVLKINKNDTISAFYRDKAKDGYMQAVDVTRNSN